MVVGAQRPASGLSSDAGMNLVGALRVAAAPEARGLGVLVVPNDEIQSAREVTKTSTLRLETFRSADLGMLGYADPDGRVAIYRRPTRRHAPDTEFDLSGRRDLPRVDIAYSYAGADGAAIDAFVARRRCWSGWYHGRTEEAYDQLAHHWTQSDRRAQALPYLMTAADGAVAVGTNQEAIGHLESARACRGIRYGLPRFQRSRRFANLNDSASITPAAVAASVRTATEHSSSQKRNRTVATWGFCRAKLTMNRRTTLRTISDSIDCHPLRRKTVATASPA
ncbi:MAG TPA: asparaginase domain-containing protein [Gemmatimonadales bacterium]|nr:asparaginase domain-containing protein [Gemmatimonadales bacterium]